MARRLSSRELLLVAGLGVLAAVWLWHSWKPETPAGDAAARRAATRETVATQAAPVVHMEQLEKTLVKYDLAGHDLFRYSQRPPSLADVRRMKEEAARLKKEQELAAKRAAEEAEKQRQVMLARQEEERLHPTPPPPPQPPAVTFSFVGFIGPPSDRIAALQQDKDTFLARKGEVVAKFFKVEEIRYESVVLSYTDPVFKGQSRELPLSRGK